MSPLTGVVLITGTDTGVGKTIVTSAVAAAAAASGLRVAVVKPAQTGEESDIGTVIRLAEPAMTWTLASYPDPLAPLTAAREAGLPPLDLYSAVDEIKSISADYDLTLVEGAGGLLVSMGTRPSLEPWTVADLAVSLDAPAIVVTRAGLGTLNHTALTMEALERRGIPGYLVLGAWPARPELVNYTNVDDLPGPLHGLLPDGAGNMDPGVFRRSAPGWLGATLYGSCDDPRELITVEDD